MTEAIGPIVISKLAKIRDDLYALLLEIESYNNKFLKETHGTVEDAFDSVRTAMRITQDNMSSK